MSKARRKRRSSEPEDFPNTAIVIELELIADSLKTSTVSYCKERLQKLITRLKQTDPDIQGENPEASEEL